MEKILISSKNPHKIEKLTEILEKHFEKITSLIQQKIADDLDEEGNSFLEIAEQKAKYFSEKFNGYSCATDGGMSIPYLKNWNPLHTRRFINKENATDFDRMDKILELMKNKQDKEREMIWNEAIAIANKGEIIFSKQIKGAKGLMSYSYDKEKYKPGIWLCSLWEFPQFNNKNFFDLTPEEIEQVEISWVRIKKAVDNFYN